MWTGVPMKYVFPSVGVCDKKICLAFCRHQIASVLAQKLMSCNDSERVLWGYSFWANVVVPHLTL